MDNPLAIVALLGEENAEKVKEQIGQLIVGRVRSDFNSWGQYLFYPPDYSVFIKEIFDECREEIKSVIREKLMQEAMDRLEQAKIV